MRQILRTILSLGAGGAADNARRACEEHIELLARVEALTTRLARPAAQAELAADAANRAA